MKKLLLVCAGLSIIGISPAFAADMAVKARPVVAPIYSWNGWYVGVNAGYSGSNETDHEAVVSGAGFPLIGAGRPLYGGISDFRQSLQGGFGGVQAGYNWQTSPNLVFGVEADIQGSSIKDSIGCVQNWRSPRNDHSSEYSRRISGHLFDRCILAQNRLVRHRSRSRGLHQWPRAAVCDRRSRLRRCRALRKRCRSHCPRRWSRHNQCVCRIL